MTGLDLSKRAAGCQAAAVYGVYIYIYMYRHSLYLHLLAIDIYLHIHTYIHTDDETDSASWLKAEDPSGPGALILTPLFGKTHP